MFLYEEQLVHDEKYAEQNISSDKSFALQQSDESEYSRLLETADIARAGSAWGEQDYLDVE